MTHYQRSFLHLFEDEDDVIEVLDSGGFEPGSLLLVFWRSYPTGHRRMPGWVATYINDDNPSEFIGGRLEGSEWAIRRALEWLVEVST